MSETSCSIHVAKFTSSFLSKKPVTLGTLIRNVAEAYTGVILFQDVHMQSELQFQKKYSNDISHMPDSDNISSATAEVFRQVEGANLKKG